jgi:hypothetical protein
MDHEARGLLESTLVHNLPPENLICYIDVASYDETPLSLGVSEQLASSAVDMSTSDEGRNQAIVQQSRFQVLWSCNRTQRTVSKIVQSTSDYGILIKCPRTGELLSIYGKSLTWLQWVDRTTGECILESEHQRRALTPSSGAFGLKSRVSTCDGASSNDRAERELLRELKEHSPSWARLAITCEIHKTAGIHSKVFGGLANNSIKGQIHWSLSLNFGTGIIRFGRILREVIRSKLKIIRGHPPPECIAFKKHLFETLLSPWIPSRREASCIVELAERRLA